MCQDLNLFPGDMIVDVPTPQFLSQTHDTILQAELICHPTFTLGDPVATRMVFGGGKKWPWRGMGVTMANAHL